MKHLHTRRNSYLSIAREVLVPGESNLLEEFLRYLFILVSVIEYCNLLQSHYCHQDTEFQFRRLEKVRGVFSRCTKKRSSKLGFFDLTVLTRDFIIKNKNNFFKKSYSGSTGLVSVFFFFL